ncbi:phospholipase D-like domain-containing protein [Undibacterium terreum]|uniref:phospholipase D n=1 Tax=Undibacterium terreum TaxID=1224302 RepID=A0A916UY66_9BURK|nr:phospholipase D-like domain-containing protein [Undibacterium terreum]GGC93509.1 hypothetical protein GCM10011396_45990 [Undibacterium terreum]
MRAKKSGNGLAIQAIAGTHVVILGWDLVDNTLKKGLLGFAIQRTDHTEGESYWLRGMKSFPDTSPPLGPGGDASTFEQPLQGFQWGDYTAKPGHSYTYLLVAMYGKPGNLDAKNSIAVKIQTEPEWGTPESVHSIFFNRGAVASQEYARRFQNKRPDVVGAPAYTWLSRGLEEAILAFVDRAKDHSFSLRGAFYEYQWADILRELKVAEDRGVDVEIVYDAIQNAKMDPVSKNESAIALTKIKNFCTGFQNGKLMHNKFLVLLKNGNPIAVLTGSTNLTENGIFGHLNCAHIIDDASVAQDYLQYWLELKKDPGTDDLRSWTDQNTPVPTIPLAKGISKVFSPQTGLSTLRSYGDIAGLAKRGLFMTFAFGMNKVFQPVYRRDDDVLRFALMEKEGNGASLEKGKQEIGEIRKLENVLVAVGHNISVNSFDRWLKEASSAVAKANVHWIHTKFMLVDPLGNDPIVISGSANFSDPSTNTNEENMLLIRGDKRVADIYLGEFMRSFAHYAFREALFIHQQEGNSTADWKPQNLATDNSWLGTYFKPNSAGALKRLYFSGQ